MDGMIFVRTAVFMHYIRSEVPFFLPATVLNRLCATHTGGYGFCHIPTAPGTYEIDCPTWIPEVCVVGIGSLLKGASELVKDDGLGYVGLNHRSASPPLSMTHVTLIRCKRSGFGGAAVLVFLCGRQPAFENGGGHPHARR